MCHLCGESSRAELLHCYTFHSPFPNSACHRNPCAPIRSTKLPHQKKKGGEDIVLQAQAHENTYGAKCMRKLKARHKQAGLNMDTGHRPPVGSVGDKGCRITGGPQGVEQVICLKREETERTPTWHDVDRLILERMASRTFPRVLLLAAAHTAPRTAAAHTRMAMTKARSRCASVRLSWNPQSLTGFHWGTAGLGAQSIGTLKLCNLRVWGRATSNTMSWCRQY